MTQRLIFFVESEEELPASVQVFLTGRPVVVLSPAATQEALEMAMENAFLSLTDMLRERSALLSAQKE